MKTVKRTLAFFLCAIMLFGSFACGERMFDIKASADYNNLYWELDDNGNLTIKTFDDYSGSVSMSGNYEYFESPWAFNESIKKVIICPGIADIADSAFAWCTNLESVSIPDTVERIGTNAFAGCSALKSVSIPDSVIEIGDCAFSGCTNLESVYIDDTPEPDGMFTQSWIDAENPDYLSDVAFWDEALSNHASQIENGIPKYKAKNRLISVNIYTDTTNKIYMDVVYNYTYTYYCNEYVQGVPTGNVLTGTYVYTWQSPVTFNQGDPSKYDPSEGNAEPTVFIMYYPDYAAKLYSSFERKSFYEIDDERTNMTDSYYDLADWSGINYNTQYGIYKGKDLIVINNLGNVPTKFFIVKQRPVDDAGVPCTDEAIRTVTHPTTGGTMPGEMPVSRSCIVERLTDTALLTNKKANMVYTNAGVNLINDELFNNFTGYKIVGASGTTITAYRNSSGEEDFIKRINGRFTKRIYPNAFDGCRKLKDVYYREDENRIKIYDGNYAATDYYYNNNNKKCLVIYAGFGPIYGPAENYGDGNDTFINATWHYNSVNRITFNANGGMNAPSKQIGKGMITLSDITPERDGYYFLGWALNSESTTAQYYPSGSFNLVSDTTLYAVWKKAYTLSYDANGGTDAPASQSGSGALTLSSEKPVRDGYTFLGWSTDSSATTAQYQPGTVYYLNSDRTLYAVWKQKYQLTYNANGGTGAPSAQNGNGELTLSNLKPSRSGYAFLGWATRSSALSPQYQPGSKYNLVSDVTFYAVWQKIYTLSYVANGGTGVPDNQQGNGNITLSAVKPTRSGYVFVGWWDGTNLYQPGQTYNLNADTSLIANWQESGTPSNPETKTTITVKTSATVEYRSAVTVKASADRIPDGCFIAIYDEGTIVAMSERKTVSYRIPGELKSDRTLTVKIIDSDDNVQKDDNGRELSKDIKITVKSGFFDKLIAFFKGLFGLLPSVEI